MTREKALVKKIKEWTGSAFIGDDCAVLEAVRSEGDATSKMLVTSDTLVENVHFRLDFTDWRALGHKSCAVNLSDIAAMAGRPRYLTMALSLPQAVDEENLRLFYEGFVRCASQFGCAVVGGDLTGGRDVVIAVTAIGESHERGVLTRAGAKPGDVVVVTGRFGASAAGLQLLLHSARSAPVKSRFKSLLDAHFEPQPRLAESHELVELIGSRGALMDASDGLADALVQIADCSHVDMRIDLSAIPVCEQTLAYCESTDATINAINLALYGGEDYELVGTMAASAYAERLQKGDFAFKKIGVVVERENGASSDCVKLFEGPGTEQAAGVVNLSNCFEHFC